MRQFLPTIILRHRKENLKKCSLRGLEDRKDFLFFTYPKHPPPSLSNYILLTIDAPVLSKEDASYGLFLIDGTWKYAGVMESSLTEKPIRRSLPPSLVTAYPRKQTFCTDPEKGLASIEALYAAYKITGRSTEGLFDRYYWKEAFMQKNPFLGDIVF